MTNDEYKGLLASMIAEPDKANDTAKQVLEAIAADAKANADAQAEIRKQYAEQKTQLDALTKQVNEYKAKEFLGSVGGGGDPEPYDPIAEAVKIAQQVINPAKGDK